MKKVMPQEIEVWYLIPALRKEIAQILIESGSTQREAAETLGLTEAAISQYIKAKRAQEVRFSKKEMAEIKKAALRIKENKEDAMKYLYTLSQQLMGSKSICEIHKKHDPSVPSGCDICMK